MTLTQIRYFLELCRTMNFTKAAANLYVTQPTLSRQIQQMETELGVTLLKRNRREVILTPVGEVFRNEFGKIDAEIELAITRVKKASETQQEIRVGFSEMMISLHLVDLIEQIRACFPEYSIRLSQGYHSELKYQMERGMLDIVVSVEKIDYDNWAPQWQRVYNTLPAYFTYSPRLFPEGYQPTIEDFRDKKFVFAARPGAGSVVRRQHEIMESVGLTIKEENCVYADEVLAALMFNYCEDSFAVFCNPSERGLKTLPLPEGAKKFRVFVCWNQQTMPQLERLFSKFKNDAPTEDGAF